MEGQGNYTMVTTVSDDDFLSNLLHLIFALLVCLPVIVSNILVIIVVKTSYELWHSIGMFMISLALADLGVGLVAMERAIYVYVVGFDYSGSLHCIITGYLSHVTSSLSLTNLAIISLDKLVAILYPIKHMRLMRTNTRILASFIFLWVFHLLFYLLVVLDMTKTRFIYIKVTRACVVETGTDMLFTLWEVLFILFIPSCIIGVCYAIIYRIVKRQGRVTNHILLQHPSKYDTTYRDNSESHNHTTLTKDELEDHSYVKISQTRELVNIPEDKTPKMPILRIFRGGLAAQNQSHVKATRTILILTVGFYVSWIPYAMFVIMYEMISGQQTNPVLKYLCSMMAFLNSLWSPIVYIPTITSFREGLKHLFQFR